MKTALALLATFVVLLVQGEVFSPGFIAMWFNALRSSF